MVELDDGPYVIGRFVTGGRQPTIGDRVTADFAEIDGVPSVRWRAAGAANSKDAGNSKDATNSKEGDSSNGKA
jgi:hypothetical protein